MADVALARGERLSMIGKVIRRALLGLALLPVVAIAALHLAFTVALHSPPPAWVPAADPHEYYFAYGSNMSPQYLGRIRGIDSQWSAMAQLADYEVQFSLDGIAGIEPAFANLAFKPGAEAFGVVHRLTPEQVEAISNSEGDAYGWTRVAVTVDGGERIDALTLLAPATAQAGKLPSRRYLGIMHRAAIHFGFPQAEIDKLDPARGSYVPLLSESVGVLIQTLTWFSART